MTSVKGASQIAPLGVRLPEDLKIAIQERARLNGRSMNSEIVQILQAAIDEEVTPKSIESFAQQEADKFKEALLETLTKMYGK